MNTTPDRRDPPQTGVILLTTAEAPVRDLLWAPLCGRPLCVWALDACLAARQHDTSIGAIALVVAPERLAEADALVNAYGWPRIAVVAATEEQRLAALRAGLAALETASPGCEWILMLDGARPLVTQALIAAGLTVIRDHPDAVAVATEPVKETLKHVQGERVVETLPRDRLARAQTPYVFRRTDLLRAVALAEADGAPGGELALARAAGLLLIAYPGSHENLLATNTTDLPILAALLDARLKARETGS
ncbi:MAG: 2-C-methyl-D-erythritol 4-phosphate cytidylyltransferase [Ktedonobacterales bacterium]